MPIILGSPVPVIAQLCPPQSLRVGDKPLCPSGEGASRTHATRHSPSPPLALDICAKRCIADDADKIMLARALQQWSRRRRGPIQASEKPPRASSIERAPERNSGNKQVKRGRRERPPANRRAGDSLRWTDAFALT